VSLTSQVQISGGASIGDGVFYGGYTSVRDNILGLAINGKTSDQASLTAQNASLTPVNQAFSGTTTGIGADMNALFSALSALSTTPTDASARQSALSDASQLANDFHEGAATLSSAASGANQQVVSTVAQINQLTKQIATLNQQLAQVESSGQDGGALQDQRDALTTQLAGLTGVSVVPTESQPMLTTASGSPLVIDGTAYTLQVATGSDGKAHVLDAEGNDITAKLSGGTLGGALTTRDSTIPALSNQLDTLASQFAAAMNAAQASGYDANGNPGAALFSTPSGVTGAAQTISVALQSGSGLAVSSDGSQGSSGNIQSFLAVQSNPLQSGSTPTDAYASLVNQVGAAGSLVSTRLAATTASLNQLTSQQSSESGVSIDEESTNLIRFQQAYAASARVISTINQIYNTVMNMATVQ
jgi:flagellar hook-associated protein 1 FlgK